uniref:Circumsporozoite protein-like n=1 Tax=Globodera pallida TaxID=36090 RepID=A0A183CAU7_GLOPA
MPPNNGQIGGRGHKSDRIQRDGPFWGGRDGHVPPVRPASMYVGARRTTISTEPPSRAGVVGGWRAGDGPRTRGWGGGWGTEGPGSSLSVTTKSGVGSGMEGAVFGVEAAEFGVVGLEQDEKDEIELMAEGTSLGVLPELSILRGGLEPGRGVRALDQLGYGPSQFAEFQGGVGRGGNGTGAIIEEEVRGGVVVLEGVGEGVNPEIEGRRRENGEGPFDQPLGRFANGAGRGGREEGKQQKGEQDGRNRAAGGKSPEDQASRESQNDAQDDRERKAGQRGTGAVSAGGNGLVRG